MTKQDFYFEPVKSLIPEPGETGYYVRVPLFDEDGNATGRWGSVDIALLNYPQRDVWLGQVAKQGEEGTWLAVAVEQLNAFAHLNLALAGVIAEIQKCEGAFSMDRLKHANNVIERIRSLCDAALEMVGDTGDDQA